jgi:hypothetical protein
LSIGVLLLVGKNIYTVLNSFFVAVTITISRQSEEERRSKEEEKEINLMMMMAKIISCLLYSTQLYFVQADYHTSCHTYNYHMKP